MRIEAVESKVAARLGLDVVTAASGIIRLLEQSFNTRSSASASSAATIRASLRWLPAEGPEPLHAVSVARELGCPHVYVPRLAGVFCAFGMCRTDIREDVLETWLKPLEEQAGDAIGRSFDELDLAGRGSPGRQRVFLVRPDLRTRL